MFSSTIKILSVSDYIAPSQECIKPLLDIPSKPNLIKVGSSGDAGKVSLTDCLACSGCVTTAETMLIEAHSIPEFCTKVVASSRTVVALSAQSRASIAVQMGLSVREAHWLVEQFLHKLDPKMFPTIMNNLDYCQTSRPWFRDEFVGALSHSKLPLLCSECPGWVCYAEKTIEPWVIQHMSAVKSPQQLFGVLMKEMFGQQEDSLYLVTVMPCYDKKLEAVRKQNAGEVGTVISTGELFDMIKKDEQFMNNFIRNDKHEITTLQSMVGGDKSKILEGFKQNQEYENSTSNGYLDQMIQAYVVHKKIDDFQIVQQTRKNQDFIELHLKQGNETIAQFARVYGLKNITNLMTQMKNGTCKYLYVEIMACPAGCINGGGQIKGQFTKEYKQQDYVKQMQQAMYGVEGEMTIQNMQDAMDLVLSKIQIAQSRTSFETVPKLMAKLEW